jgi:hypothetical protein
LGLVAVFAVLVLLLVLRDQSLTRELVGYGLDQVIPILS